MGIKIKNNETIFRRIIATVILISLLSACTSQRTSEGGIHIENKFIVPKKASLTSSSAKPDESMNALSKSINKLDIPGIDNLISNSNIDSKKERLNSLIKNYHFDINKIIYNQFIAQLKKKNLTTTKENIYVSFKVYDYGLAAIDASNLRFESRLYFYVVAKKSGKIIFTKDWSYDITSLKFDWKLINLNPNLLVSMWDVQAEYAVKNILNELLRT